MRLSISLLAIKECITSLNANLSSYIGYSTYITAGGNCYTVWKQLFLWIPSNIPFYMCLPIIPKHMPASWSHPFRLS